MKDTIKFWDDNLVQKHINYEISLIKSFFKDKKTLCYIDIGANVGKFYDVLSKSYEIKKVVMVEPAPQLYQYISNKFKDIENCKIYDFAVSNESGETFFQTTSLENCLNKESFENINLGLSKIDHSKGHKIKVVSGSEFLASYVDNLADYDFIKIDTESKDYLIIESITDIISKLENKPFILFEHNYYHAITKDAAKEIIDNFTTSCEYEPVNFDELKGDCCLMPKL